MAETIKARVFLKNGIEEDWAQILNYIPGKGEIIIYNVDENHNTPRLKVGDGVSLPKDLPFVSGSALDGLIAKKLEHKLTFGANGEYQFDGSEDVNVPVYTGNIEMS